MTMYNIKGSYLYIITFLMKCVTKSMSGHGLQAYIWKTPLFPLTKSMMDPLLGPVYFNPQMKIQRGQQHALFITLIFAIIPV